MVGILSPTLLAYAVSTLLAIRIPENILLVAQQ
jgi:hypothetical protein